MAEKADNGEQQSAPQSGGSEDVRIALVDRDLLKIGKVIGLMLIAAGALTALALVWPVIQMIVSTTLPFAVALIFAYIFDPIVTFFQKKLKLTRIGGVLFLYGVFILAISGFFALVLPILISQIQNAYFDISGFIEEQVQKSPQIQEIYQRITTRLGEMGINLEDVVFQSEGVRQAASNAASSGFRAFGAALQFIADWAMSVFGLFVALSFVFLVNIYLLLDFSKLRKIVEIVVPAGHQDRTFAVLTKLDIAVGGFIRGMLISGAIVGTLQGIGMFVLGVSYITGLEKYALLIGIIAGFGTLVPYLGTIAGGAPAVFYVLFSDDIETLQMRIISLGLVLALLAAIQTIEGLVLQPKIVGTAAQLHPVAVIFALAMGANFGILGMILAVPVAAGIRVLIKEFYWDERVQAWKARQEQQNKAET